jgi:transcription initiation factor TFIIIB Brf1 subunit/transcription initiation factor TFIIB
LTREVSRDFGARTKNIIQTMSENDCYIPSLTSIDYIHRISKQLNLPDDIRYYAIELLKQQAGGLDLDSTTPVIRACIAVINAADIVGLKMISKKKIASILNVSFAGINLALRRGKNQDNK